MQADCGCDGEAWEVLDGFPFLMEIECRVVRDEHCVRVLLTEAT